jgi:hypothetical protein
MTDIVFLSNGDRTNERHVALEQACADRGLSYGHFHHDATVAFFEHMWGHGIGAIVCDLRCLNFLSREAWILSSLTEIPIALIGGTSGEVSYYKKRFAPNLNLTNVYDVVDAERIIDGLVSPSEPKKSPQVIRRRKKPVSTKEI